jgi:hypothetical protein
VVNELVIYDREPPSIDEIVIALINRLAQTEQGRKKSKFERHRLITETGPNAAGIGIISVYDWRP